MKGEKLAKRSSFSSIMRKRLSDITNSQSQPKLAPLEEKRTQIANSTEDLINELLKEKATLMKLIEERNKIIELSGNELRNLRATIQKLQLQNWNLAQSNSQILAELNCGRDKVKALQHELACKDALLKSKNSEKEGKADTHCQNTGSQEGEKVAGESSHKANNNSKHNCRSRRRAARSQSMGPSTTHRAILDKEKVENKRRCLRRQSARFKSQEREPSENLFEIEVAKFSAAESPNTPSGSAVTNEPRNEKCMSRRSSMGRPVRRATEKVQSYKEIPVNVKMRRAE